MTDSSHGSYGPARPGATALPRRLLLAGGGHAHLAVLEDWIRRPPTDWETSLISSDPVTAYSGMIPGWMAGHYEDNRHVIDLRPLAKRAGVKLVIDTICGLDADRGLVFLGSGKTLSFDLISMATGSRRAVRLQAFRPTTAPPMPIPASPPSTARRVSLTRALEPGAGCAEAVRSSPRRVRRVSPS